jgi:hypothetical protein
LSALFQPRPQRKVKLNHSLESFEGIQLITGF